MAAVAITAQKIAPTGTVITTTTPTATDGNIFVNNGARKIYVKNGSASPINVTIKSTGKCSFGVTSTDHDIVVAVANGAEKWIGPFDKDRFNDTDGKVTFICSAVTTVSVAVAE